MGYFVGMCINAFFVVVNLHYALQIDKTPAMITLNGAAAGVCAIWFLRDAAKWLDL